MHHNPYLNTSSDFFHLHQFLALMMFIGQLKVRGQKSKTNRTQDVRQRLEVKKSKFQSLWQS